MDVRKQFSNKGAIEVLNNFKFAIVFENSNNIGYITEKLLNGYASKSLPIYFGGGFEAVDTYFNLNSFVYCDLPYNITSEKGLEKSKNQYCTKEKIKDKKLCESNFRIYYYDLVSPFYDKCVKKIIKIDNDDKLYDQMLSEPLLKFKKNNITNSYDDIYNYNYINQDDLFSDKDLPGLFNRKAIGKIIRFVFDILF